MSEPLLRARALTKTYTMGKRSLEVLRGVDLDVARGEFLALRGASGAGKSTLLHLIGGLDLPNAGEILFDGNNLVYLIWTNETSVSRITKWRWNYSLHHESQKNTWNAKSIPGIVLS